MKLDDSLLLVPNPLSRRKNCSVLWIKLVRFIVVSLFGFTEVLYTNSGECDPGEPLARPDNVPPPVFTGAAPLPLGSLPAGLPTQLIRLWQGTHPILPK